MPRDPNAVDGIVLDNEPGADPNAVDGILVEDGRAQPRAPPITATATGPHAVDGILVEDGTAPPRAPPAVAATASKDRAAPKSGPIRGFIADWCNLKSIVEAEVTGPEQEKQMLDYYPIYITLHATFAVLFWFIASWFELGKGSGSWFQQEAGLDSFSSVKGKTTLRVHTLDGEDLRGEIWRVFTYQFTHVGFRHIFSNVIFMLVMGIPQEGFHGHWIVALIFNLGVICGSLAFMVSDCHMVVVGMSGGCYALTGMMWANLIVNWSHKRYRKVQLLWLLLLMTLDIVLTQIDFSDDGPRPSYSVHFGGILTGLILGSLYGRKLMPKQCTWLFVGIISFVGVAFFFFAVAYSRNWPPRDIWESQGWCWAKAISNQKIFGDWQWRCVRCGSQECIDAWSAIDWINATSIGWCEGNGGWVFTEDWEVISL